MVAVGRAESGGSTLSNRVRYLQVFALLLAAGLALDPSIYIGKLTHVYLHDLTFLGALALDPEVESALVDQRRVDPEMWK